MTPAQAGTLVHRISAHHQVMLREMALDAPMPSIHYVGDRGHPHLCIFKEPDVIVAQVALISRSDEAALRESLLDCWASIACRRAYSAMQKEYRGAILANQTPKPKLDHVYSPKWQMYRQKLKSLQSL